MGVVGCARGSLSQYGSDLTSRFGQQFTPATDGYIGAATGIEFLGGGRYLAAAEPTRRGGGSAAVVRP